jgi:hypothetical protein
VSTLILGFAVGQIFCADKAEIQEADKQLGTEWTWVGQKPSELMVNLGVTIAIFMFLTITIDLALHVCFLRYCTDRDNADAVQVWNEQFSIYITFLYICCFCGFGLYLWLLCVCFTLRYPNDETDELGQNKKCTENGCHESYDKAITIFAVVIVMGLVLLGVVVYLGMRRCNQKLMELKHTQLEVPGSIKDLVDEIMAGVEGAPLWSLYQYTSTYASMVNTIEGAKEKAEDASAQVVLEARHQVGKVKDGFKKLFGRKGKSKVMPEREGSKSSIQVTAVSPAEVEADDHVGADFEQLEPRSEYGSDAWVQELHDQWRERRNQLIKGLRDFAYFEESGLTSERSDVYLLHELKDAGIDNARDRACIVDMLLGNGHKVKAYNKLIWKLTQDLRKGWKHQDLVTNYKFAKEEKMQYQAMSSTFTDEDGDDLVGVVPRSLMRHVTLKVEREGAVTLGDSNA